MSLCTGSVMALGWIVATKMFFSIAFSYATLQVSDNLDSSTLVEMRMCVMAMNGSWLLVGS